MGDRRAIGKAVLLALCWIVSSAAFFISLTKMDLFSLFLQVFVPAALIFGYISLWPIPRVFLKWQLWIAAVVFAAVVTIGASYEIAGSAELVTNQKGRALVYFLGRVPAFYMGMVLVLQMMHKGKALHRRYAALWYMLALCVCWIPYLYAVWPGSLSSSTAMRIMASAGMAGPGAQNPLLFTGLVGLAVWIGKGIFGTADAAIAIYVLMQALLMAWLLGQVVSTVASGSAPKWLVLASLVFFALCPVFPLYAFTVSAYTSFALAVLWLMLMVWRLLRGTEPRTRDAVALCASAVLCVLLSDAGIWLVLVSLSASLVWLLVGRNGAWSGAMYVLACAVCAWFILQTALLPMFPAMDVADKSEPNDAPFHYGYLMPGFVSGTEPTFILGTPEEATDHTAVAADSNKTAIAAVFGRLLTYAPFRILVSPGLYGWIALFALAVALALRRWDMTIQLLVPLMALAIGMASPVNGSLGKALPVCLAAPLLLAAVAQALRRNPNQFMIDRRNNIYEM